MEKKKSIGFKKIIVSILSILFVVCAYVPNIPKVNALTNVITYNNYGSFSRTNEAFGLSATTASVNLGCSSVVGELNGIYNGVVTINYSIGNGLSIANFSVIPENCHIISYSSSACTIEFYGVSNWTVTFLETQTKNVASLWEDLTIQSLTGWNMTYLERSDSAVMVNIQNRLSDLKTYTDGIEGLLSTNNQLLQTIANNGGSGGGSSTVNNIDINVDHIADELSLLKTSNDSILDELLGFFTDGLGQVLTIENVVDAIETTTTALTGISTQLTNMTTTLSSINATLSNINTAVQNIDNSIDTISWKSNQNARLIGISETLNGTYSLPTETTIFNDAYIQISDIQSENRLYKMILPVRYNGNNTRSIHDQEIEIYSVVGNNYYLSSGISYYYSYVGDAIWLYLSVTNNAYPFVIHIKNNTNVPLFYVNSGSLNIFRVNYIDSNDIEYWEILSYIDQYNMQRQILDALESMSVNITQNDITEMNTNINEYNQTMTSINQIENNYINNFNTLDNGIDLSNNSTPSVNLRNARIQFSSVFNDITADLRIRGLLIFVLICGIILILLGA